MRTETCWLPSAGGGRQFARLWLPDAPPRAVLLIAHGLSEYGGRYDAFARWLAERCSAVVEPMGEQWYQVTFQTMGAEKIGA